MSNRPSLRTRALAAIGIDVPPDAEVVHLLVWWKPGERALASASSTTARLLLLLAERDLPDALLHTELVWWRSEDGQRDSFSVLREAAQEQEVMRND